MRTALSAEDVPVRTQATFLAKLDALKVDENGCRLWVAATNAHGYGRFASKIEGQPVEWLAHRLAFVLLVGPLAAGEVVRHRCDFTSCTAEAHLLKGTQVQNLADMVRRGRSTAGRPVGAAVRNAAKERCKRDHDPDWFIRPDRSRSCCRCKNERRART